MTDRNVSATDDLGMVKRQLEAVALLREVKQELAEQRELIEFLLTRNASLLDGSGAL